MTGDVGLRDARTQRNPLQLLIDESRRERGLSYADIAEVGGLSRSTVYYLAQTNPLLRSPAASTLQSLARGLQIPLDVVRQATAAALGLHVETDEQPDLGVQVLMASVEKLTPQQRQHVAALVRSLLTSDSSELADPDLPTVELDLERARIGSFSRSSVWPI